MRVQSGSFSCRQRSLSVRGTRGTPGSPQFVNEIISCFDLDSQLDPQYTMVNATKERGYQSLTTDASQVEIVTLAVYLCGGGVKMVDTEDAAVKANELAPGRFSWRKYPEQINIELVRSYLSAAKRRAGYLNGTGTQGWSLTPAGLAWAESAGREFLVTDQSRRRDERKGGGVEEQGWRRGRARKTGTRA